MRERIADVACRSADGRLISTEEPSTSRSKRIVRERREIRRINSRRPSQRRPQVFDVARCYAIKDDHSPGRAIDVGPADKRARCIKDMLHTVAKLRRTEQAVDQHRLAGTEKSGDDMEAIS
jgi:hypothetical protein